MANFEDTGTYYAGQGMAKDSLVLSMGSRLVYNTEDTNDVRIVKKVSGEFFAMARSDIAQDGSCFYGKASVHTLIHNDNKLCWEF